MRLIPIVAALLATVAAPAAATPMVASKRLAAMSPDTFRMRSVVDADPLEFETVISTERAFRSEKAARGTVWSDAHLRAVVDRQTGATHYEVRKAIRYLGPRREFKTAQFRAGTDLRTAKLTLAEHGGDMCSNSDFNADCHYTKILAFPVDEAVLREVAAAYRPGERRAWGFKLKDVAGRDVTGAIAPAEAAGLLDAVAQYRTGLERGGHAGLGRSR